MGVQGVNPARLSANNIDTTGSVAFPVIGPEPLRTWMNSAAVKLFLTLLWLVPLVPLAAGGRRGRVALLLLASALVLTQTWYPRAYAEMADRYHQPETWFLLLRDVLLVLLAGVLSAGLVRRRDETPDSAVVEVPPRESIAYHAGGP